MAALAGSLAVDEVMGFGCQWSGAAVADQAGLRGLSYNRRFYLLPVRCLGQIDPVVMGRAFLEGANGLLLIGCNPEECHHSYGIDHTWSRVWVLKKLLVPLRPGKGAHRPGPQRHYQTGPVRDHGGELHENHGDPGPH